MTLSTFQKSQYQARTSAMTLGTPNLTNMSQYWMKAQSLMVVTRKSMEYRSHDNFVIYSPHIPSNNVPPVLNPVIPSYENEPQYLTGLMSDIFKGNNVNYMTIGIFLLKIILFQKLLLLISVYCIASLHWAIKEHKDHKHKGKRRTSSEEGSKFNLFTVKKSW